MRVKEIGEIIAPTNLRSKSNGTQGVFHEYENIGEIFSERGALNSVEIIFFRSSTSNTVKLFGKYYDTLYFSRSITKNLVMECP
jgi:hypothetical protein